MADEPKKEVKPTQAAAAIASPPGASDEEHYEEVSEYRIGEGAPPIFLVVCFLFITLWAMFSWVPFFGY